MVAFEVFNALDEELFVPEIMIIELLGVLEEELVTLALMFGMLLAVVPEMLMFEDAVRLPLAELDVFIVPGFNFSCVLDCA